MLMIIMLAFAAALLAFQGITHVFRSANGGYVEVATDVNFSVWVQLDVATWELEEGEKDTENTHSGTGGSTNYEHVVYDNSSSLKLPWDEDNTPEAYGIYPGQKIGLRFKHGSGAIKKTLLNTKVGPLKTINDNQGDIVRIETETKGGYMV